jgi:aspartate aminotransferase
MTHSRVSNMADRLVGSEILRISAEIRARMAEGKEVCNLTVGDFAPSVFRIPDLLEEEIVRALRSGETNYPPSDGVLTLRRAVADFYERRLGLRYPVESILITGGARPGIYATYRALVDPGDTVVYSVPSWNNNHYVHLVGARGIPVVCEAADAFLPTRAALEQPVRGARLLVLNSPLNPSGTAFSAEALSEICELVLEENARRSESERPLFVLYDQVYWMLTSGSVRHVDPVSLFPAMSEFTVFIDGISKAFAATGVRLGWAVGPSDIIRRMADILGHIGAWAPRAEQIATAHLLGNDDVINTYHESMQSEIDVRLAALYEGLERLRAKGLPIETIRPAGAIYLSAYFGLHGCVTASGVTLITNEDIRRYLLEAAGLAIVPFQAFGYPGENGWFRLSVGALSISEIAPMFDRLAHAFQSDLASSLTRGIT